MPEEAGRRSIGAQLREWAVLILIAFALVFFVQLVIATPYRIPSESMEPTLVDGDRVVVNRLSYSSGDVQRGEVVVFERPPVLEGTDDMIKRVIGLPGEAVRIDGGEVYVGGLIAAEPYLAEESATFTGRRIPGCDASTPDLVGVCIVPEGHVFVLGDNRGNSADSRFFGPIPVDDIIGRAAVRVWPLTSLNQL